jgi:hypothetical protein
MSSALNAKMYNINYGNSVNLKVTIMCSTLRTPKADTSSKLQEASTNKVSPSSKTNSTPISINYGPSNKSNQRLPMKFDINDKLKLVYYRNAFIVLY